MNELEMNNQFRTLFNQLVKSGFKMVISRIVKKREAVIVKFGYV